MLWVGQILFAFLGLAQLRVDSPFASAEPDAVHVRPGMPVGGGNVGLKNQLKMHGR